MAQSPTLTNTEKLLHCPPAQYATTALEVFHYQHQHNHLYRQYCDALGVNAAAINDVCAIPFLPISFFKTHQVVTGTLPSAPLIFESSGTTGTVQSKHYIADPTLYRANLLQGFAEYYGPAGNYALLALLPSYLERQHSSLVFMAKELMAESQHPANGFFIREWDALQTALLRLQ
ncbi:MAG: acyl transferase, partial [Chitinophagia bacterium]|nr:acyl transferase [Chitinophagia bacterium]